MAARALRVLALAIATAIALSAVPAARAAPTPAEPVTIHLFWGSGCPHCAALRPFLEELAARPGVELADYEVWYDEANRDAFRRVAAAHGIEPTGVPAVFIAGQAWIGDSTAYRQAMEAVVDACTGGGCPDVASAAINGTTAPVPPSPVDADDGTAIDVPLLGTHDVGSDSLVWATALIAFVDGFNPCSLWVLTVLLAMILRTGSRARLALIGGTYVTTAAVVYGVFLVGLFGALTVVDYAWWIRVGVATVAAAFAVVNVKDYFWFGRGVSLTIPDRFKPSIVRESRSLALEERRLPGVVALTAGMAAGVALLELPCTVGFPVVWSNLLAERGATGAEYAFLLAVYLLIFLLDELAVLTGAIVAMRMGRVEERHGRVLKLGGGVLMGVLAVTMLVSPTLLETLSGAATVFLIAAVGTAAIVLLHPSGRVGPTPASRPAPAPTRPSRRPR
jgi:thiol-disulfide isomerase/thioredoxin